MGSSFKTKRIIMVLLGLLIAASIFLFIKRDTRDISYSIDTPKTSVVFSANGRNKLDSISRVGGDTLLALSELDPWSFQIIDTGTEYFRVFYYNRNAQIASSSWTPLVEWV